MIMWWQVKFAKNAAFGFVPFSQRVRQLKRTFIPYQTTISEWTLEEGLRLVEMLRNAGCDLNGKTVVEIGTGWQPTIPLLFSLAGCERVVLIDSQRLMDQRTFIGTVQSLANHGSLISARMDLCESHVRTMLMADHCHTLDDALKQFRFEYLAPYDMTSSQMLDESVDVLTSRAVFEHIPLPTICALLKQVHRVLRPTGVTAHAIDNSDHWSHSDHRLSRVNFLRYGDRTFGLLCRFNPLDYQNRLRHFDYLRLFGDAGFDVVSEKSEPEEAALRALKSLPLAPRFRNISHFELAKLDSYIVARKPDGLNSEHSPPCASSS